MFKQWNKIDLAALGLIGIILFVVFWTALNSARARARDAQRLRDAVSIQEALKLYYNDHLAYPSVSGQGQKSEPDTAVCASGGAQFKCYLPEYPRYPKPIDGDFCLGYVSYSYSKMPASEGGFSVSFCLGRETEGLSAGPHRAAANGIR